jgi:hypothetical protein
VCEDSAYKLAADNTNRLLDHIIPKLLHVLSLPSTDENITTLKLRALKSYVALLNLLGTEEEYEYLQSNQAEETIRIGNMAEALVLNMGAFVQLLASLAGDAQPEVSIFDSSDCNHGRPKIAKIGRFTWTEDQK